MKEQDDLFSSAQSNEIIDLDKQSRLIYCRRWLSHNALNSSAQLNDLIQQLPWQQPAIKVGGRAVSIPRMQCWFGDKGAYLRYSGKRFEPNAWDQRLSEIRLRLESELGAVFNSVLANYYRDGNDSVGWHADDEAELGETPLIASISIGATRRFLIKPKTRYARQSSEADKQRFSFNLNHGDLLVMQGLTQKYWQHCLPKTQRTTGARINLTYRHVVKLT